MVPVHRAAVELPLAAALRLSQRMFGGPYLPWIPFGAMSIIRTILCPTSRVLEFGSGRSTIWYAAHAGSVVSIEENPAWHSRILSVLSSKGISNVDYRLRPRTKDLYCDVSDIRAESIDLCIIDGMFRDECALRAVSLIAPNGWIYLDNSDKEMTPPQGETRDAEKTLVDAAARWGSAQLYVTGYSPGNLHPHQGMFVHRVQEIVNQVRSTYRRGAAGKR